MGRREDEDIFQVLPPSYLRNIASCLGFDGVIDNKLYSLAPEEDQLRWLDKNRNALKDHFCWVGSHFLQKPKSYHEIVLDTARKIGALVDSGSSTAEIEKAVLLRIWNKTKANLTEEQLAELDKRTREVASKHRKKFGKEFTGLAALSGAQLSGFGIYMLGSTLLGMINGALGLGLSFGVFTGLSSLISVIIGPVGWVTLGIVTIAKLGGPNYKKLIPAIIVIATYRAEQKVNPVIPPKPALLLGPSSLDDLTADAPQDVQGDSSESAEATAGLAGSAAATYFPHPSPPKLDVAGLKKDIEQAAENAKQSVRPTISARPPRRYSKQEKTIFRLKFPELCDTAEYLLNQHYLEVTEEDQSAVRDLVRERHEFLATEQRERKKRARKNRKKSESQARLERRKRSQDTHLDVERKKFRHAFPNLRFRDGAIRRYIDLGTRQQILAYEQFGQMNRGNLDGKHQVPRTEPRLFQRDAGADLRIYYRREGTQNHVVIHLIGTKNTQDSDYKNMQNRRG
jgi:uncharacterized protein YaaW (UPF0174 family)